MPCPICKKPTLLEAKPFCSVKCQQLDLLNWLNENYKIPAENITETDMVDLEEMLDEVKNNTIFN